MKGLIPFFKNKDWEQGKGTVRLTVTNKQQQLKPSSIHQGVQTSRVVLLG